MIRLRNRPGMVGACLVVVGGIAYGYVRASGGWPNLVGIPAKLDASTPSVQRTYTLLGIARATTGNRQPVLRRGEDEPVLGGAPGPAGSTRIWIGLPTLALATNAAGKPGIDQKDLTLTLKFADGAEYPLSWEMAMVEPPVVTAMIPAGYEPTEWADVEISHPRHGKARWRLRNLPEAPVEVGEDGPTSLATLGIELTARARRGPKRQLIAYESGAPFEPSVFYDLDLKARAVPAGESIQAWVDRVLPERTYPTLATDSTLEDKFLVPGETWRGRPVALPYGDRLRRIALEGRLVRVSVKKTPLRWTDPKFSLLVSRPRYGGPVQSVVILSARALPLPGDLRASVGMSAKALSDIGRDPGSLDLGPRVFRSSKMVPGAQARLTNLKIIPPSGWREALIAPRGKLGTWTFPAGTITADLVEYQPLETRPFRLTLPLGDPDPRDLNYRTDEQPIPRSQAYANSAG